MDFGLSKYLEMFEKRFGQAATTVLLVIITMALVAVCLHLIWADLLSPIMEMLQNTLRANGWESLLYSRLVPAAVELLIVFVVFNVISKSFTKKVRRELKEIHDEAVLKTKAMDENELRIFSAGLDAKNKKKD